MELVYIVLLFTGPPLILAIISGLVAMINNFISQPGKKKTSTQNLDSFNYYKEQVLNRDKFECRLCGKKNANEITTPSGVNPSLVCFSTIDEGSTYRTILKPGASLDEMITVCTDCKSQHEQRYNQPLKEKVLERDNFKCKFCGSIATDVMTQNPMKSNFRIYLDDKRTGKPNSSHISICSSCKLETISPMDFEKIVGQAFEKNGYIVKRTGGPGDEGIDLICEHPYSSKKFIVQCKRYKGKVGVGTIRDFYGALIHSNSNMGYIVTTGEFTEIAKNWAKDKNIKLIDGHELIKFLSDG